MEISRWKSVQETSRRIVSSLRPGRFNILTSLVLSTGLILATTPSIENEPQIPDFMVDVKCQGATPLIEVQGNVEIPPGKTGWLVATEPGSRRFRVLKQSNGPRWMFLEQYPGFADPKSKYTELPIGAYNFTKGKDTVISIYSGSLSSRRTPLLDKVIHEERRFIPTCP